MKKVFFLLVLALLASACSEPIKKNEDVSSSTEEISKATSSKVYYEIADTTDFTGSMTVEMNFVLNSYPSSWAFLITKMTSDFNNEFNIRIKNDEIANWFFGTGKTAVIMNWRPKTITLNKPTQLIAVRDFDKGILSVFINGKAVATKNIDKKIKPLRTYSTIKIFGSEKNSIDGSLSSLQIWKRALSKDEIKNISTAKSDNKVGSWDFTKQINNEIVELSGKDLIIKQKNRK
ncbi:MAG: hypothetical protein IPO21_02410 [Bacteroidales bacterium]|nr:hypothetical protein [Bacteroidales bacterium]